MLVRRFRLLFFAFSPAFFALALPLPAIARDAREPQGAGLARPRDHRVHTYSIVARDARTGALGVAVQSHWFQVGTMVPWAEAGVGAIATQALTNPSFGPRGLAMLRAGKSPKEVIAALLKDDPKRENRQVIIIDAKGRVAAHTGKRCIAAAGHETRPGRLAAAANLMKSRRVWRQMSHSFAITRGKLAEKLLAALVGAQKAGGDLRGKQSAALLVVAPKSTGQVWKDRLIDLRVADHPRPLEELRRLLRKKRGYQAWAAAGAALTAGKKAAAKRHFARARRLLPKSVGLYFWHALALYGAGQKQKALGLFKRAISGRPAWRKTLTRLPSGGLLSKSDVNTILRHCGKK
jgi:uncharacterized Ntn-hydrolase superfamily protein